MGFGREGRKMGDGIGRAIVIASIQILIDGLCFLRAMGPRGADCKCWRRRVPARPKRLANSDDGNS